MLKVIILGAGGSAPPPGYGGPSILLNQKENYAIIDCGENCLSSLTLQEVNPCKIDYVYISHIHIDHWAGLPSLGVKLIEKNCPYLTVMTHTEAYNELRSYLSMFMPSTLSLELKEVSLKDELFLGSYSGRIFKVYHKVPTYGVIFLGENGEPLMAYTSDTGYKVELVDSIPKNLKALFIETTLPSGLEEIAGATGHLTVSQALRLASLLRPSFVVSVHLSESSLSELLEKKPENVIIPRDGMTINL
ncbi:MAG: MBL fold metallo-hydrolase [Desulfurococcales archaeon]|nr:MBL fold metallo-hydrolase [Desulfurococcales archaeon]